MRSRRLISARIVKLYLDICLVAGAIIVPLLLAWLLLSPLVMSDETLFVDATVPVTIGESSVVPVFPLATVGVRGDGVTNLNLVKARGELRFDTTRWGLHIATVLPLLLGAIVVLWVLYLIRQVVAAVIKGAPFGARNAARIRRAGFVLIAGGIVGPLVEYVLAGMVLEHLHGGLIPLSPPLAFSSEVIFGGLIMLALSSVFEHGRELEDDKSLTI